MATAYQVYVLINPHGRYYTGVSENVAVRLGQHNAGESKWTATYRPWTLAWASVPLALSQARKFENLLKRQKGGDGFYRLTGLSRSGS